MKPHVPFLQYSEQWEEPSIMCLHFFFVLKPSLALEADFSSMTAHCFVLKAKKCSIPHTGSKARLQRGCDLLMSEALEMGIS